MPTKQRENGTYAMNMTGWPAERWAAIVVIGALLLLILIRRGFRGVNFMGASVGVS
jgi:uncharacterized membrane protein